MKHLAQLSAVLVFATGLATLGCGGDDDTSGGGSGGTTATGGSGGTATGGSAGAGGSGGTAGSAGGGAGGGSGGALAAVGYVVATQGKGADGTTDIGLVEAAFASSPDQLPLLPEFIYDIPDAATCTSKVMGECKIADCPQHTSLIDAQAGKITVGSYELNPDATDEYTGLQFLNTVAFKPGDSLTVSAEGGSVGAFTETLTVPPLITVTAPVVTNNKLDLPLGTDFDVTWTNGGTGSVVVQILSGTSTAGKHLTCRFDAAKGTATVPAATLAELSGAATGMLRIGTVEAKQVSAGPSTVSLVVSTLPVMGALATYK
jgi:hypothetical protein